MLHTLSHLLIRELALECGYNAASIRERIYADTSGDTPQAGILIYTAAADSDGTLGGLVDLGKPENLGRLLEQALNRSKIADHAMRSKYRIPHYLMGGLVRYRLSELSAWAARSTAVQGRPADDTDAAVEEAE